MLLATQGAARVTQQIPHSGECVRFVFVIPILIFRPQNSLWDGVLRCLDLTEELLRYAVIKGKLTIQHGEQDHAKSPHVTGFASVWPPCKQKIRSGLRNNCTGLTGTEIKLIILCNYDLGGPFKVQFMATTKMINKTSKQREQLFFLHSTVGCCLEWEGY